MMTPLVIGIAAGVSIGLSEVATGLVTEAIKVSVLEPAVGGIKRWLANKKLDSQRDTAMQEAIAAAFAVVSGDLQGDRLDQFLMSRGFAEMGAAENDALRLALGRAALLQTRPDGNLVPDEVVDGLRFPPSNRPLLGQFLFELRERLKVDEAWGALVEQSNHEAVRNYLHGIAHEVKRTADGVELLAAYKRLMLQHFGLDPTKDDGQALDDYIDWMNREYRHISFVLTRASQRERIRGEAELERVFVPLKLDDLKRPKFWDEIESGAWEKYDPKERVSLHVGAGDDGGAVVRVVRKFTIESALKEFPIFLLRGAPGSGKTTLLRHMTYCFAAGLEATELKWEDGSLLPVMVPLRNFGRFLEKNDAKYTTPGGRAVREFIDDYFGSIDRISLPPFFFRDRLQRGKCLVMLDGLDEVGDFGQRNKVATYVKQFIDEYSELGNRFVIASRPKGYDEVSDTFSGIDIAECDVLDLTVEDRDRLVKNLLTELEDDDVVRQEDEGTLLAEIGRSDRIDELSRNPLFCTTLVLVFKFGGELPERRVDLYRDLVGLMLERWEKHKTTDQKLADGAELVMQDGTGRQFRKMQDAREAKERALVHVAWWMQNEGKTEVDQKRTQEELATYFYEFEGAKEEEKKDWAINFLDMAHQRSGIFVEYDTETYAFSHKHFLEYLAASALIGELPNDMIDIVLAQAGNQLWDEVIKLAIAHLEFKPKPRKVLIEAMLENGRLLLAGEGIRDAGSRAPGPLRAEIMRRLENQMQNMAVTPTERFEAGLLLDSFGWLPDDLNRWQRCTAIADNKADLMVGTYPVTNAQYGLFLVDGGMERFLELPDGVDLGRTEPDHWRDTTFGRERHGFPVVGISWYEAVAYAKWLSSLLERLHGGEVLEPDHEALVADLAAVGCREVRLPTHAEWQAAAGEADNGRYPWDANFNVTKDKNDVIKRANIRESGIRRTSPVGMYPDGASVGFGVKEMSGNVFEWTADCFDEKKTSRVLAGGSWLDFHDLARVSGRYWDLPHLVNHLIGFRCVSPVS